MIVSVPVSVIGLGFPWNSRSNDTREIVVSEEKPPAAVISFYRSASTDHSFSRSVMAGWSRVPPPMLGRVDIPLQAERPLIPVFVRDFPPPGRSLRPAAAAVALAEEHLAAQDREIQDLLMDNQRLASTHVSLMQEVQASHQELRRASHLAAAARVDAETRSRELFEKIIAMESELRGIEAFRVELQQVRMDVHKLRSSCQEMDARSDRLAQDLAMAGADLQRAAGVKEDIETMRHEVLRGRAAVEFEKKVHEENLEHSQAMEKKMIAVAREVEKLRAELANSEKRALAAAAAATAANANPGPGYAGNYASDMRHVGNNYAASYPMHQVGPEGNPHYGMEGSSRGPYDRQPPYGQI